jgi:hypothetical protein
MGVCWEVRNEKFDILREGKVMYRSSDGKLVRASILRLQTTVQMGSFSYRTILLFLAQPVTIVFCVFLILEG